MASSRRASCRCCARRSTAPTRCPCTRTWPPWPRHRVPAVQRRQVHGAEFPLAHGVDAADREPGDLLLARHREPELDQGDAGAHEHALELRRLPHELVVLLVGAEAHHPFDAGAVVPTAVEQHDLAFTGEVLYVALEVPPALLLLGGLGEGRRPWHRGVEVFHEAFDGAALAGGVAALEHHADALPGLLDPTAS